MCPLDFEYLENGTVLQTQTGIERYATQLYQTGSFVNASVASISREILADPDVVIPKMRERMEAAGFDELLADVQEQINEWFASGH